MKKLIIHGCEERGDKSFPYLTRWILFRINEWFAIYFHKFHRSDAEDLHDHPWDFITIILWRGYNEVTFDKNIFNYGKDIRITKRKYPGFILFRKAEHSHRVELINNKPAYTLVFRFKKRRDWLFWFSERSGMNFLEYFKIFGC